MPKSSFEGVECRREFRTIGLGCALQRLFSSFPSGSPGLGLLLMRLALGLRVIYIGTVSLSGKPSEPITLAQNLIAVACGIFLLAGLWTPIMGMLLAIDEVWIALSHYLAHRTHIVIPVFLAVLSASVAMLGPGAWSIDARLFGRRRLYRDRNRGTRPSP
jgi:putative oxidoreductase